MPVMVPVRVYSRCLLGFAFAGVLVSRSVRFLKGKVGRTLDKGQCNCSQAVLEKRL